MLEKLQQLFLRKTKMYSGEVVSAWLANQGAENLTEEIVDIEGRAIEYHPVNLVQVWCAKVNKDRSK